MIIFRKANTSDCELIHEMGGKVFPVTYQDILSPKQMDYMLDWMYSVENVAKQMDEGHVYFIAYKNDTPCGYVSVEQQSQNLFHLQKIYVLPEYQGCKLGRALFEKATEYIHSVHPLPCVMELNVNRNNKALHFYEHMGMTIDRQEDANIGEGFYMNDYIMTMRIPMSA